MHERKSAAASRPWRASAINISRLSRGEHPPHAALFRKPPRVRAALSYSCRFCAMLHMLRHLSRASRRPAFAARAACAVWHGLCHHGEGLRGGCMHCCGCKSITHVAYPHGLHLSSQLAHQRVRFCCSTAARTAKLTHHMQSTAPEHGDRGCANHICHHIRRIHILVPTTVNSRMHRCALGKCVVLAATRSRCGERPEDEQTWWWLCGSILVHGTENPARFLWCGLPALPF